MTKQENLGVMMTVLFNLFRPSSRFLHEKVNNSSFSPWKQPTSRHRELTLVIPHPAFEFPYISHPSNEKLLILHPANGPYRDRW